MFNKVFKMVTALTLAGVLSVGGLTNVYAASNVSKIVNKMGWSYYDKLEATNENQIYSPYSIISAVSVAGNGGNADGKKKLIKKAGVSSLSDLNSRFKSFESTISKNYGKGRVFKNSNLVLVDKTAQASNNVNSSFKSTVKKSYNGTFKIYDIYGDLSGAKSYVKNYVKKATNGFIPNYNSTISKSDVVDILNAVYFKGDWQEPFSKAASADFLTALDTQQTNVDMMTNKSGIYGYYEDEDFIGVSVPYKYKNNKAVVSMYIIVPTCTTCAKMAYRWQLKSYSEKEAFIKKIKTKSTREVSLTMPKFEVEKKYDLASLVKSYSGTKFTGMLDGKTLNISSASHQAKIKVDELGTEAAAVTELAFDATSVADQAEIKRVTLNRPFIYVIRDEATGTNLFVGTVTHIN